jgi:signal transduction histidine kinase
LRERTAADEFEYSLATAPPTERQRRFAFLVLVITLSAFGAAMPFANTPLARFDGFIPVIMAISFVTDLVTAVLLFGQFSAIGSRALLVLASGYLFSSLIVIPYALAFPGAFAPTGLLGAGTQTAAHLNVLWRLGFSLTLLAYAFLISGSPRKVSSVLSPQAAILCSVAIVILVVSTLIGITTVGQDLLPQLLSSDSVRGPVLPLGHAANGMIALTNILTLLLLWRRGRSLLDLWLMVAVCMLIADALMVTLFLTTRFTLGFYATRSIPLIVSKVVLVALLSETMILHKRLASAFILQRRERDNRLMSLNVATAAIAHEISQPLTALSLNSVSAMRALEKTPPDLAALQDCLSETIRDSDRANEIVASVRGLFKSTAQRQTTIEMNGTVRQMLKMVENDVRTYGVSVSTELQDGLAPVMADRIQLQQVILNLIKNAIEAMAATRTPVRTLRLVTAQDTNSSVSLTVQDSGPGIAPESERQIFDPFFTTKSSGTGLGLSISRKIVEDHDGRLRLIKNSSNGCTFEIILPTAVIQKNRTLVGIPLVPEQTITTGLTGSSPGRANQ